jgi:hypothetical protein
MKIYIGKYKDNWISPYTVKEKFFFWKKDYDAFENKPPVLLTKACEGWLKIANFFNRKIDYVKIDYWDTWSMDSSLSHIILPMLKQLKATKHGAPFVDDEDVPPKLRSTTKTAQKVKKNDWDTDGNHFKRWDYVLDEMIWAFEQLVDDDHDSKFFDHSKVDESGDISKQASQVKFDKKGYMAHQERISNGTRLFGKYYRCLWD